MTTRKQYAEDLETTYTIIKQMGGRNKLTAMTGASQFLAIKNGLRFDFAMNSKMNRCEIVLNDMDLYDVKFFKHYKITGREKSLKALDKKIAKSQTVVAKHEGLYYDQLVNVFEVVTGLDLSL